MAMAYFKKCQQIDIIKAAKDVSQPYYFIIQVAVVWSKRIGMWIVKTPSHIPMDVNIQGNDSKFISSHQKINQSISQVTVSET